MTLDQVRAEVCRLAQSTGPIIVGPWLSEVGFELLYWIPFLRWAIQTGQIPRERLWVLSRGGCRSWYQDITDNYLELYDLYSPDELRRLNKRRIREQAAAGTRAGLRAGQVTAKQYCLTTIEDAIVRAVCRRANLATPSVLHPSMMYRAFRPIWKHRSRDIFGHWRQMTQGDRLVPPVSSLALPDRYVAVKFYASPACPDDRESQMHVQHIVRLLADSIDVVLLHTGTAYDDHGEFAIPAHSRVHRLTYDPAQNLDLQTAVIGRSLGFVGTYGGFAYLAPFVGIPTLALYSIPNFRRDHLWLMTTVAKHRLHTPFRVLPVADGVSVTRHDRKQWMAHAA